MPPLTRRQFLGYGAAAAAGAAVPLGFLPGQRPRIIPFAIDPTGIPKYVSALPIPRVMPQAGSFSGYDYYQVAAGYFRQQILPGGFPATPVFGYGAVGSPASFCTPGPTIEATAGRPVRVTWVNQLVDGSNNYVAPLVAVTPAWHWANPPGGTSGRDSHGTGTSYTGPTPMVPHLHGSHTYHWSDGYPEAWFLPAAANIPGGYATAGSYYAEYSTDCQSALGVPWGSGYSVYQYTNDQAATTMWYHDHTLGMTHCNVEAGLAGFYLLRGGTRDLPAGVLPGPAPKAGDPPGMSYYEIPVVIQDKTFDPDGTIVPQVDFFGSTITVNGKTWPSLSVEARRYRFRFLNGSMVRTYVLKLASNPTATRPATPALPFWQIGADGGFLPAPVQLDELLIMPAERCDVIVDFTAVAPGTSLYLINEGPDSTFASLSDPPADPATTGQVMRLTVVARTSADASTPPGQLSLPAPPAQAAPSATVRVALWPGGGIDQLASVDASGNVTPRLWSDPVTEVITAGQTVDWEIYNTYGNQAHPVHLHLVEFQVLNRQPFTGGSQLTVTGSPVLPAAREQGAKDTVMAPSRQVTRVRARFDRAGRYVWHCHLLRHEDNEMMRPYQVQ